MTDPNDLPEEPRPDTSAQPGQAASARRSGSPDGRGNGGVARPVERTRIGFGAAAIHAFFTRELWSRELASLPTFRRWWYGLARVVHLTGVNFVKDRCTWRASALTYITVLTLVPMLALAFSVAKGMGAYETLLNNSIVPFLDSTFGPAELPPAEISTATVEPDREEQGSEAAADSAEEIADDFAELIIAAGEGEEQSPEPGDDPPGDDPPVEPAADDDTAESTDDPAAPTQAEVSEIRRAIDTVLGFVQDTNVSRLGVLGFLIVLYTVIKLLGSVEVSFNDIWGVQKSRSLTRKIADYFSTIVLVPLLLVTGTGVLGMARTKELDRLIGLGGDSPVVALFGSLAVVWVAFAFAYLLMPNTRVKITSALVGGIVGGTMWQLFQYAHLKLQIGVANYNAIYSTFAALPIFLFWVQSSWMTVLLGAEAASAHQNQARHGQMVRSRDYDLALKEVVALRLVARITRAFLAGVKPLRIDELADRLGCPDRTLLEIATALERASILAMIESDTEDPALVLVSDPEIVRLQEVLDALKGESVQDETREAYSAKDGDDEAVDRAFEHFRASRDGNGANLTLRELAASGV